jgi:hypothetical protein
VRLRLVESPGTLLAIKPDMSEKKTVKGTISMLSVAIRTDGSHRWLPQTGTLIVDQIAESGEGLREDV